MPVVERMLRSVTFIIGDAWDAGRRMTVRRPVGTGFFVAVPGTNEKNFLWHTYIVTAAHVITGQARTEVRVRSRYGDDVRTLPITDWVVHEAEDVAATPFTPVPALETDFLILPNFHWWKPPKRLARVKLGEPVSFLGMLAGAPDMNRRAIPLVRSGTAAALYERVPIDDDGREVEAHLIDCRSYNGFSGAPCFSLNRTWRLERDRSFDRPTMKVGPHDEDHLLGMLVAHYDDVEKKTGVPVIKLNIGIGVVLPIERVYELLNDEVFRSMREAKDNEEEAPREATLDSDSDDAISLAPLQFEEAVKGLLSVRREDVPTRTEETP